MVKTLFSFCFQMKCWLSEILTSEKQTGKTMIRQIASSALFVWAFLASIVMWLILLTRHIDEKIHIKPYFNVCLCSKKVLISCSQGSHRNSKTQFHDFSMVSHNQQCNFHAHLMHRLQPPLLAATSPH